MKEKSLFRTYAFASPKDSPYIKIIDHYINKMQAIGFMSKIKTKYEIKPQRCPDFNGLPLTYANCGMAFIFMALGFTFGLMLLIMEIISKKYGYQLTSFDECNPYDCSEYKFMKQMLLNCYVNIDKRDFMIQKMTSKLQRISLENDQLKKNLKMPTS